MVRFSNNIKGSDRNVNIIKHSFSFSKWWEERKNKRDIRKSKLSIILSSGKIIDTLYDLENSLLSNDEDKFKSAYQTLNSAYRYFKGLLHRSYVIYIDKRKALGEVEAVPMPLLPAASLGKDNEGPYTIFGSTLYFCLKIFSASTLEKLSLSPLKINDDNLSQINSSSIIEAHIHITGRAPLGAPLRRFSDSLIPSEFTILPSVIPTPFYCLCLFKTMH